MDITDADSFMELFTSELQEDGSVTAEEIETLAESLQTEMKNLSALKSTTLSSTSSATIHSIHSHQNKSTGNEKSEIKGEPSTSPSISAATPLKSTSASAKSALSKLPPPASRLMSSTSSSTAAPLSTSQSATNSTVISNTAVKTMSSMENISSSTAPLNLSTYSSQPPSLPSVSSSRSTSTNPVGTPSSNRFVNAISNLSSDSQEKISHIVNQLQGKANIDPNMRFLFQRVASLASQTQAANSNGSGQLPTSTVSTPASSQPRVDTLTPSSITPEWLNNRKRPVEASTIRSISNINRSLQPMTKKSRQDIPQLTHTNISQIPTSLSISSTISTTQQFYSGPNGGMVAVMPKTGFTSQTTHILQKTPSHLASTPSSQATPPVAIATTPIVVPDVTKLDTEGLQDVMQYVGVDLKEEESNILRDNTFVGGVPTSETRDMLDRSRVQNFVNTGILMRMIETITQKNGIKPGSNDIYSYLALATQSRLRSLLEQMIAVSKNRTKSYAIAQKEQQDLSKMKPGKEDPRISWKIAVSSSGDVRRHLRALEHLDRVKERTGNMDESLQDSTSGQGKGNESGSDNEGDRNEASTSKKGGKKRSSKDSSDKNISEAVRSKITNQTAVMFAGGSQKSWMIVGMEGLNEQRSLQDNNKQTTEGSKLNPSNMQGKTAVVRGRGRPPKSTQLPITPLQQRVSPVPVVPPRAPSKSLLVTPSSKPGQKPTVLTAEQYYKNRKVVTVRDAVFCLERERVTGARRGRTKGWKEILNRAYATRMR